MGWSNRVKCPGVIGWKANARPPGWKVWENAPLLPGGGWALLELTDALQGRSDYFFDKVIKTPVLKFSENLFSLIIGCQPYFFFI